MLLQDRTRAYQYRGDIMIKIEVRNRNSLPFYLSVKGHAGSDNVCAGASAIIQTAGQCLLRGLELSWDRTEYKTMIASGMFVVEIYHIEKLEREHTMARDWMLNIIAMLFIYANQHDEQIVWTEVDVA